jgi:hypothetical protein
MKMIVRTLSFSVIVAMLATGCKKDKQNKPPIADAGPSQTIQLPVDSVAVSGTATDGDGKVVGFLWSEVSGPNTATIAYTGAASTKIRGLIAGTYLFQFMVNDDMGATGVDTISITVNPPSIYSLNLQPANNPNEALVWGNNTNEEQSSNGAPEIDGAAWTHNGNPITARGLFKFDLSTIPASATILSAKLTLYSNPTPQNGDLIHANAGSDNSIWIQRVVSTWTGSTVRWTNQPATTTSGQISIPHTNQAFLDLVDVDVTNLVQTMVTGNSNYGFMIRLQTEAAYNSRIFGSSFYTDASKHPKLVVQYMK